MKKILSNKPSGKKKPKSKSTPGSKAISTLFDIIDSNPGLNIPYITTKNTEFSVSERDYLQELINQEDYNVLKIHLVRFGEKFEYEPEIKAIVRDYADIRVIKYIIKSFLNQYSLTFQDYYQKFLKNPDKFIDIIKYRKKLLSVGRMNPDEILDAVRSLKETHPSLEKLIAKIEIFDTNLILMFIKEFLNQTDKTIHEFYKIFINEPNVAETITEVVNEPVIGAVDIPIVTAATVYSNEIKECMSMYSIIPWLVETVEKIYITNADSNINKYVAKIFAPVNIKGTDWYRVNKKYYELQCDPMYDKIQTADILNFYDKKTKVLVINLKVAYETSLGKGKKRLIIQDETIFNAEQKYLYDKFKTIEQKLAEILKEPVGPDAEKISKSIFNAYFNRVSLPGEHNSSYTNISLKINKTYVDSLINLLIEKSNNVREFASNLADICIYISFKLTSSCQHFKNQLGATLYTPTEVLALTKEQKLPEVFGSGILTGSNTPQIQARFTRDLENSKKDFVDDFADRIYIERNPFGNHKIRSSARNNYMFRFDVTDFPSDWKTKCSTIFKIPTMEESKYENKLPSNVEKTNENLASGLLDYIIMDINKLMQLRTFEGQNDGLSPEEEHHDNDDYIDNYSVVSMGDGQNIIDKVDGEEKSKDNSDVREELDDNDLVREELVDNDLIQEEQFEYNSDSGIHEKSQVIYPQELDVSNDELTSCHGCSQDVTDGFKTILWVNDKPLSVNYCSLKCMGDFNFKHKQYKCKKPRKEKTSK